MPPEKLETIVNQSAQQPFFNRFCRKIMNLFDRESPKVSYMVYLNANFPLRWKPYISHPDFPNVTTIRTLEGTSVGSIPFLNNTHPKKATDLLVVLREYYYRPVKYVIATLEWNVCQDQKDENNLSLVFEQIRRNWRANLFLDGHPEERGKKHPTFGHGWAYDGTALSSLMDVKSYIASAKKDAIKVAKAYELIADHCETYNVRNAEMFSAIARAFKLVGKHRIQIFPLSKEEKEWREKSLKSHAEAFPATSKGNLKYYVYRNFSLDRYENIVPPQLAQVFLNALSDYKPFRESSLTSMKPELFYISKKLYKKE